MSQINLHDLTKRQREIFLFIVGHTLRRGYQPSNREIGEQFGLSSTSTVYAHLQALERKGCIRRTTIPRGLEIIGWQHWLECWRDSA